MNLCKTASLFFLLFISVTAFSQDDTTLAKPVVFETVEKEATYPGGEASWRSFLERNLNANVPVENGSPVGQYTVWVQFIVDRQGNVSDIKTLTNLGYGMEQEVVRILKKSGQWEPAQQNGRSVKAYRKQPITFVVEDESFQISTNKPYTLVAGIDNEVSILADKVKSKDLQVFISKGTIQLKEEGQYIVRVPATTSRVIITLFNAKKNKEIGRVSFEVK